MDNLTIYSTLLSANGRKVQAVCYALGLSPTIKEINIYSGEGQNREYLNINPLGQIPTLVDDKIILTESNAIMVYLSEQYGGMEFYDSDPSTRAEINKWLFWESSQWQPILTNILGEIVGHKLLPNIFPAPQRKTNWQHEHVSKLLWYLEKHLSNRKWLVEERLTLADFAVGGMVTYFNVAHFLYPQYPNISVWFEQLSRYKAWQSTLHPIWK